MGSQLHQIFVAVKMAKVTSFCLKGWAPKLMVDDYFPWRFLEIYTAKTALDNPDGIDACSWKEDSPMIPDGYMLNFLLCHV